MNTAPSRFADLLKGHPSFAQVVTFDEMVLTRERAHASELVSDGFDAAVLFESLDRVDDPVGLLKGVSGLLKQGGILFMTDLVSSGFASDQTREFRGEDYMSALDSPR